MRPLRDFEEFIKEGIVKVQTPDASRANFLRNEASQSYTFLKKIIFKFGITDENSNVIIKESYDSLMELVRSKMLLQGFNSSGQGAHEAEVAYLRKLGFKDLDVQFANELRYYRNGITYYGKRLDKEYAQMVIDFVENMLKRLN